MIVAMIKNNVDIHNRTRSFNPAVAVSHSESFIHDRPNLLQS